MKATRPEGQPDAKSRARAAARTERQAQKEAARAEKRSRKRAARDRKAERALRKRERKERRQREKAEARDKSGSKAAEKPRPSEGPKEAEKPRAEPRPRDRPKAEKRPVSRAAPAPVARGRSERRREEPRRERDEPSRERDEPSREREAPPRREREAARGRGASGAAPKGAGSKLSSALTGPRARRAAARVDGGIQSAWKLLLAGLGSLLAGALVVGHFVAGGLREIGAVWIRTAEILGEGILWVERRLRPLLLAALRGLRSGLRYAERVVTPRRTVAFVVVAAAVALAASQFVDYRGVRIGAPQYAGVEAVAPAPQTDRATTGSVHSYAMVPVAAVIIVAALLALRGRWRVARVIPILAALAIAVTLLLDARKGLDEGEAAVAYQGAQAVLIEGFWLQLAAAFVLVVTGILLVRYARTDGVRARRRDLSGNGREPSRRGKRRFGIAGVRA